MLETGKHRFFHAAVLFSKPSRQLMAKTIVVLRQRDGVYLWCVRFHLSIEPHRDCGRTFLWPLGCEKALGFYLNLLEDDAMVTSTLVQVFRPFVEHALYPAQFEGVRPAAELESGADRSLVASLSVVSHDENHPISRMWMYWHRSNVITGAYPPPRAAGKRRSPRLACLPMVEVLGGDVLTEVLWALLRRQYLSPSAEWLHEVLSMRLVCKAFNAEVCDGMARTTRQIFALIKPLMFERAWECVLDVRAKLTWAGVGVFRALSELDRVRGRPLGTHEAAQIYMRLLFNKPAEARPPLLVPPPPPETPMGRVLGEAPNESRAHGKGTRRMAQARVRFRMKVPGSRVLEMVHKGWHQVEPRAPKRVEGGVCVFPPCG